MKNNNNIMSTEAVPIMTKTLHKAIKHIINDNELIMQIAENANGRLKFIASKLPEGEVKEIAKDYGVKSGKLRKMMRETRKEVLAKREDYKRRGIQIGNW